MTESKCEVCGKPLTKKQIIKKSKYCSRSCYYKSKIGHEVSEETRKAIAATKIGKPRPKEMVDRVAKKIHENYATGKVIHWQTGVARTDEMKQKQSETMKRLYASGEIVHPQLGKTMPEAAKMAIRLLKLGSVASAETKQKMSETRLGGYWCGNVRYHDNPYCEKWTAELRERVRAYFDYTCFECGEVQNDRKLNVHHVHYDKKTCCNGSPQDLVPLCPVCHTKTNFNRDYWEDHFTEKLYLLDPDGKCFFTKEEMREFKLLRDP